MITEEIKEAIKDSKKGLIKKVLKRSGKIVEFSKEKIKEAILKAAESVGGNDPKLAAEITELAVKELVEKYNRKTIPAIEEIQDTVERVLIKSGHAKTAKAYIIYREQQSKLREKDKLILDINKTMDGYLNQSDWRVNENSNVNYSLGGLILHNSGTITANYWLNNIYSSEVSTAHREGDFHIHDLSMFSGYCAGWSLRQLIEEGLGGVRNKINSKPPKHLSTLISQMVNFLGTMQNEWAGAQAFSSFDTYLAPFIKVDNLSYEQVKQQIQSFVFSINTPSRWGSQAPFTNITLDWIVPDDLKDRDVLIGGEKCGIKFGECQEEVDMVNRAFIEVMMDGDADGRGFPYPIPTYNITKEFDWDSANSKILFEMTAKYGTPYFQNFINSNLNPEDVRSMCCRLQLDKRELRNRGGGLFGADEMTGSIGVVTINLARIGFLSDTKDEYFHRLSYLMEKASESLVVKRKVINRLMDVGLYPYTKRYLKHFNNHFSTIGINGMNESIRNFMDTDITTDEGVDFTTEVLEYMRDKLSSLQEETGDLYNLEATPAESTSYRLAKIDKAKYPDIITAGEKDPYYTNSTQLPVGYTSDVFEALDLQEKVQSKYTGGTVFHGFLGERIKDYKTCKKLVQTIANKYRIPYFTISPTFSVCPVHGYLDGEHFHCPKCKTSQEKELKESITSLEKELQNMEQEKAS